MGAVGVGVGSRGVGWLGWSCWSWSCCYRCCCWRSWRWRWIWDGLAGEEVRLVVGVDFYEGVLPGWVVVLLLLMLLLLLLGDALVMLRYGFDVCTERRVLNEERG